MKKILVLNPRRANLQSEFDEAVEEMLDDLAFGKECHIELETLTGKQIKLVEGYLETEVSEDNTKLIANPCAWFNDQVLSDLKVEYKKYLTADRKQ